MDESNREEEKITRMMIPIEKVDNKSNNYLSQCYLWYLIMCTFITLWYLFFREKKHKYE